MNLYECDINDGNARYGHYILLPTPKHKVEAQQKGKNCTGAGEGSVI
jgi:hypothetical protein